MFLIFIHRIRFFFFVTESYPNILIYIKVIKIYGLSFLCLITTG